MKTEVNALSILKHELEFLDHGGYRESRGGRQPLFCMETEAEWKAKEFFEDSPSCPKKKYCACAAEPDCFLKSKVPAERQKTEIPCRHIPLNEKGDTIASLSKIATHDQVESVIRGWLVKEIGKLEQKPA